MGRRARSHPEAPARRPGGARRRLRGPWHRGTTPHHENGTRCRSSARHPQGADHRHASTWRPAAIPHRSQGPHLLGGRRRHPPRRSRQTWTQRHPVGHPGGSSRGHPRPRQAVALRRGSPHWAGTPTDPSPSGRNENHRHTTETPRDSRDGFDCLRRLLWRLRGESPRALRTHRRRAVPPMHTTFEKPSIGVPLCMRHQGVQSASIRWATGRFWGGGVHHALITRSSRPTKTS